MNKQQSSAAIEAVLAEMRARGWARAFCERRINWTTVAAGIEEGASPPLLAMGIAAGLGDRERREDEADDRHDQARMRALARSASLSLKKCEKTFAGTVAAGEHMNIHAKKYYWFSPIPPEDDSDIEIETSPPLPGPGPTAVKTGNSITLAGPCAVWVHLTTGEEKAKVDITIG